MQTKHQPDEFSPIGMFDSGVGGLTVFEQVTKLLPNESIVFLADTARVPYGGRPPAEILKINREILDYLMMLGCKFIIMACGTSSSIAFPVMKNIYKVPMLGMIEGGSRMAVSATKKGRIGVIATAGTINSGAYQAEIKGLKKDAEVFGVPCPLLVPLIEGGFANSDETARVLKDYLKPLIEKKIDTLILGCTHYPHVINPIREILGSGVTIINPAEEVAKEAKEMLIHLKLASNSPEAPKHRFLVTANGPAFRETASRLLGRPIPAVEEINVVKNPS
jgi:glutamate racemase